VNNHWIDRHFAFFKGLDKIEDTECALALKFGTDCYIVRSGMSNIKLFRTDNCRPRG
jgi:hypothetical protein